MTRLVWRYLDSGNVTLTVGAEAKLHTQHCHGWPVEGALEPWLQGASPRLEGGGGVLEVMENCGCRRT